MQSSVVVLPDLVAITWYYATTQCLRTLRFGQLILRKIIKIVATICQIIRLKCTKIQFRLELNPRPPLGELTVLSQTP